MAPRPHPLRRVFAFFNFAILKVSSWPFSRTENSTKLARTSKTEKFVFILIIVTLKWWLYGRILLHWGQSAQYGHVQHAGLNASIWMRVAPIMPTLWSNVVIFKGDDLEKIDSCGALCLKLRSIVHFDEISADEKSEVWGNEMRSCQSCETKSPWSAVR